MGNRPTTSERNEELAGQIAQTKFLQAIAWFLNGNSKSNELRGKR